MKKRFCVLSVLIMSVILCYGAAENLIMPYEALNYTAEHLAEHRPSVASHICEYISRIQLNGEVYAVNLRLEDPSYVSLDIYVSAVDGSILYCNCERYSDETVEKDMLYHTDTYDAYYEAFVWETALGPQELWTVSTNAAFYQKYGFVPFASYYEYETNWHCDLPDDSVVDEKTALKTADEMLKQYGSIDADQENCIRYGSVFYAGDEIYPMSRYLITYYMPNDFSYQGLQMIASVGINAKTGLVYSVTIEDSSITKRKYYLFEENFGT